MLSFYVLAWFIYTISISLLRVSQEEISPIESNLQTSDLRKETRQLKEGGGLHKKRGREPFVKSIFLFDGSLTNESSFYIYVKMFYSIFLA